MSGITTNPAEIWTKHVFVKFGNAYPLPVQASVSNTTPITEGQVLTLTGSYTVSNSEASTTSATADGIAVFRAPEGLNETNTEYPLAMIPNTPGVVISIPVECFASDPGYTTGNTPTLIYVNSSNQLDSTGNQNSNPYLKVINEENGYCDCMFCTEADFTFNSSNN